jgi:hypothetical protein
LFDLFYRLFPLLFDTLYPGGETVVWNELGTGGDGQIAFIQKET